MRDTIKALLFDFTKENLEAHIEENINMTSGNNILNDIIQFKNENFIDNPFVKLIDIEFESDYGYFISDEQMSKVLGIDNNNIFRYAIYGRKLSRNKSTSMSVTVPLDPLIIANKAMFEESYNPIFEIKINNKEMSSWQAIAGKFILIHGSIPGGVAEVYNPIRKASIESFERNFQIRFSGVTIQSLVALDNPLHRICKDPFSSDLIKIIDPSTYQILFDSHIIKENSSEKSREIWQKFDERYR
ncbi:hypothetical protein HRF69_14030 [Bacillus circulans]|uniref:hypothetical protein n=1 Tax=Niallia circulans TaxID=1397 RepID=UPI0002D29D93|nr:hypothetical protein [Niallia circulans]NRG28238.1 hypothetical protein [Niallia circulans]